MRSRLLEMADVVERSGAFDGLWVGDILLAKARVGTACMVSLPLRRSVPPAADFGTSGIPEVREESRGSGEAVRAPDRWGSLKIASAGDRVRPAVAS